MTIVLSGTDIAPQITRQFPGSVAEAGDRFVLVKSEFLFEVAQYVKNAPELACDYLNHISAVDYYDYFEVVYYLVSITHNHSLVLKTRCYDRNNPVVPSVVSLWQGADFQEREIYDLMGIAFAGHPNLKRIALWAGFKGHPLRKDYLE